MGSVVPDAIVLQPSGDEHTFYVLCLDEEVGWESMHLTSEGYISWQKETPFKLILFFLSQSSNRLTVIDE